MATIFVSAQATIDAAPEAVYAILADYRNGHPRILPERYFRDLVVEQGGVGAGTRIRFVMIAFGQKHTLRANVDEPEPGRVLTESYPATGMITTFIVDPLGTGAQVTITTEWTKGGLAGLFEKWMLPRYLRKVFAEELRILAREAARALAS